MKSSYNRKKVRIIIIMVTFLFILNGCECNCNNNNETISCPLITTNFTNTSTECFNLCKETQIYNNCSDYDAIYTTNNYTGLQGSCACYYKKCENII